MNKEEVFLDFYSKAEEQPFFRILINRSEAQNVINNTIKLSEGEVEAFIEEVKNGNK